MKMTSRSSYLFYSIGVGYCKIEDTQIYVFNYFLSSKRYIESIESCFYFYILKRNNADWSFKI
uniref:Uncharacterized protein n=1 Tax=Meloidogyne enterolobii TaxID=390850 RepID=A0A6V7WKW2_MELEN|nr:unnamed protein product [Meloidogyne enterolobii]